MRYQVAGNQCHIVAGTSDLQRLLKDVQRLKHGHPSELPEFFGFVNWSEVVEFSSRPDGEYLRTFVKLVNDYGEDRLLFAIGRCVESEPLADVVLSTAHKAKGREWSTVQLDGDFDAAFVKMLNPAAGSVSRNRETLEAETRLFYVAMTRAQQGVELPNGAMSFFGIAKTHAGMVGTPRTAAAVAGQRTRQSRSAWQPVRVMHTGPMPVRGTVSQPLRLQQPKTKQGLLERIMSLFR